MWASQVLVMAQSEVVACMPTAMSTLRGEEEQRTRVIFKKTYCMTEKLWKTTGDVCASS